MRRRSIVAAIVIVMGFPLALRAQEIQRGLVISRLTGDFYIYTTCSLHNGTPVPSNSMYFLTDAGAVMIDTPWDTTQFQPLLDSIQHRHHMSVVLCIATHFHADRTAGLDFLKQRGVKTFSTQQTRALCIANHDHLAEYAFTNDTTFRIGNHEFQTYYPGKGHTSDNIVVWFDREKILYGGCLVKSTENDALGNIDDADLSEWPRTIRNVMGRFPHPHFVVPGHYAWTDNLALEHTLNLLLLSPVKN